MKAKKVESAAVIESAPAAVIESAPAPTPSPAVTSAIVDGINVSVDALAKLERDWKSACGRITSAVDRAAGMEDLEDSARRSAKRDKRSGIMSGKDGTRRNVALVAASPSAVDKASKELETLGFLGSRDADLWRSYVRLALALEALESIGRLS